VVGPKQMQLASRTIFLSEEIVL